MTYSFRIFTRNGETDTLIYKSCVLALGTFDGVHTAHARLLRRAVELSSNLGADGAGAWCFEDAPASLLCGKRLPALCSREDKVAYMLECGLDFVVMGKFEDYMKLSASGFINEILRDRLNCIGTVCGFNHRFGHGGLGTPQMLVDAFGERNAAVLPEMLYNGETVSSSAIREYILNGNVSCARAMLGRNYSFSASVLSGKKLGRTIGFPTVNQKFDSRCAVPKFGIYATICTFPDGKRYFGVSNVGIRPTIENDDHAPNCETYLIDYSGDAYGLTLKIEFCEFLREEQKFSSVEELSRAIKADAETAIGYFNSK